MVVTVLMKTNGLASTFPGAGSSRARPPREEHPPSPASLVAQPGSSPHGAIYWLCDHGELFTISVPESLQLESKDNDGTHPRVVMVLRGVLSCKALSMAPSS